MVLNGQCNLQKSERNLKIQWLESMDVDTILIMKNFSIDSKNIDISLIPSQYFNEQFNAHGLDRLTEDVDLSENSADNTISQEVNDEKPTQQSEKPKSKAMETKELDRDIDIIRKYLEE